MRLLILVGCSVVLAASPGWAAEPTGDWMVENGLGQVRIENCSGSLWGVVSWEKVAGRDTENPDPALRGRPMLGVPILLEMKPNRDRWEGHVYNAENGKTYTANIKLTAPNTLRIEGCILGGFFCGGQDWTRVVQPSAQSKGGAQKGAPKSTLVGDVCSRVSNLAGRPH